VCDRVGWYTTERGGIGRSGGVYDRAGVYATEGVEYNRAAVYMTELGLCMIERGRCITEQVYTTKWGGVRLSRSVQLRCIQTGRYAYGQIFIFIFIVFIIIHVFSGAPKRVGKLPNMVLRVLRPLEMTFGRCWQPLT